MVNTLSRNWWTLVLRGVAAVLFGIWAFVWPDITFTILVLLFGAYALWDGVFALIGAFRTQGERRWMLILEGVVGVAMGLVTFLWPGAATLALLTIIAAWAIITGIFEIIAAIRLREEIEGAEIAFLEKPYTALVLARRVRETLDARKPADEHARNGSAVPNGRPATPRS